MSRASRSIFAALAMFAAGAATADTYYLKATTEDSGTSDPWRTEGIWTNATGEAYSITASGEGADVDDNEFAVGPNVLLCGRWGSGTHTVFPGKTLTLSSASSSVFNPRSVKWTIPNLIVDTTSAAADAVVIDSNGAGFNLGAESAEAITIEGTNLTIKTKSDLYAIYDIHGGGWTRNFEISSPLTGSGNLMLRTRWEGDSTATKNFYLTGDNSRFTGRLCISGYSQVKPAAWLHVADAKQLGGNPGTLQQRGLELYRIANMKFTKSAVVDQPNRGLYINQTDTGDTGARGRIDVESGCSVVYTGPWSFSALNRVLSKYGYGSLYLSGGLYPGGTPGWFQIYYGVLKLNAQDFNMQNTAKVEKDGGILQIGSNGVARINNAYVKYTGSLELVDTATLELFKSGNVDYVPITTNAILNSGTTLSCPSNGTVTASAPALVVRGGSTLDFTLHGPSDTVKLSLSKPVTLDATAENPAIVKVSSAALLSFGDSHTLIAGGSFPSDAVSSGKVVLSGDSSSWAVLAVDGDGNLVVKVAEYFYIKVSENATCPVPYSWILSGKALVPFDAPAATVESALSSSGANGIERWKSYCLGLDPNDAASVVLCTAAADQPEETGKVAIEIPRSSVPAELSGVTVKAYLDVKTPGDDDWTIDVAGETVSSGAAISRTATVDEPGISFFE